MRDVAKARSRVGDGVEISTDGFALVRDPAVDIVVELIGGDTLARELVLEAIAQGQSISSPPTRRCWPSTATDLRRRFGPRRHGGVRGPRWPAGCPSSRAIREGLTANRIEWVAGIINGTTNFILSEMRARGLPFADVLAGRSA